MVVQATKRGAQKVMCKKYYCYGVQQNFETPACILSYILYIFRPWTHHFDHLFDSRRYAGGPNASTQY